MKLIIDIDKRTYEAIKITPKIGVGKNCILDNAYEAIRNGTPLPKGHGRLIDADAYYESVDGNTSINMAVNGNYIVAPTIIESDTERSEE